ncbi:MAG: methyltransferase domain-containing protein [Nanoarchaeota archaeon]|nr:methyltransferase domain-containing protein [Nanoarchaeota archaeon]
MKLFKTRDAQKSKKKYFENRAKAYELYIRMPVISKIRKDERKIINELIENHITKDDSVLEIGCGTGYYTAYVAERCKKLTAIDLSEKMVQLTSKKIKKLGLENVDVQNMDINKFSSDQKFDKVFCIGVLDYVKEPLSFLQKCSNLSSGSIIVTAPNKSVFSKTMKVYAKLTKAEHKYYTDDELKNSLVDSGFKDVEMFETGMKTKLTNGATLIAVAKK